MARRAPSGVPASLFVDSSAWLAFFSARDNHHPRADFLIREAFRLKIQLLTSNLVLAEVQRLLLYRAGGAAARAALERVDQSRSVTVCFADAGTHQAAQRWLAKLEDQVISYTDAASFALMQSVRCTTVLGFDQDFVIAGFTLWAPG